MQFKEKKGYKFRDEPERPPQTAGLRDRLAHFTWYDIFGYVHGQISDAEDRIWFAATMSTGALAVVLGNTPNTFPGLKTIGTIVFIFDLVLFLLFNGLMITRFILVPRKFLASLHHPVEGLFHGTYWVSVALILNCAYIYGSSKAGAWLDRALMVCFWIYYGVSFIISIMQYSMFFRLERLNVADAIPAWIFPIYPLLVVGSLAGTILPGQPESESWQIFVGGILAQGLAWSVSFLMYAIYMQRLMTSTLPSPSVRPGMFVSVGPAGEYERSNSRGTPPTDVHRLYGSRTVLPGKASTHLNSSELLDKHICPRWGNSTHTWNHGRPLHNPLRLLVLLHYNGGDSLRSTRYVVLTKLVGFHLSQRRAHSCNYPGVVSIEQ